MEGILFAFMVLAGCGFALSVAVHSLALAGITIPGAWVLHIGIFVVWIPTVIISRQQTLLSKRRDYWKDTLAGCPGWMRSVGYVLLSYTLINFLWFIITSSNQPKQSGTEMPAFVVRGFSGHWMIFYGAAFATLYSRIRAPHLYSTRQCPKGHEVLCTAPSCPECGYEFPDGPGDG